MKKMDNVSWALFMMFGSLFALAMIVVITIVAYNMTGGGYGYEYARWYYSGIPFATVVMSIVTWLSCGHFVNELVKLEEF